MKADGQTHVGGKISVFQSTWDSKVAEGISASTLSELQDCLKVFGTEEHNIAGIKLHVPPLEWKYVQALTYHGLG
jgi:hypothetical protein